MLNFILHIIIMRIISFGVLSANAKFFLISNIHSVFYQYALNLIRVLYEKAKFNLVYYQHMYIKLHGAYSEAVHKII
jgi:hypothetical protein